MKILFFDTETNGLPKNYKASALDVENWPRIIQLAWHVADTVTDEVQTYEYLIKPEGWTIPADKFWLDNGFHQKTSLEKGTPMAQVMPIFIECANECDAKVAHNLDFDNPILGAEMIRMGLRTSKKLPGFCTMATTVQLCKIPFANSKYKQSQNYKWPKLEELYRHLFKKEFSGAHQAGADVTACRECFFELVRLGVIKLPEVQNA